jgi:hypothetical protein
MAACESGGGMAETINPDLTGVAKTMLITL